MEPITEFQTYENNIKKNKNLTLKSQLYLFNNKLKSKKRYMHLDSYHKNNETCEMSGTSRINSISNSNTPLSTSPNKKAKGRVSFAPKYKLISYVYYNPNENIIKEENKDDNKDEKEDKEKAEINHKNKTTDKVAFQCTCLII